ncbi:MAG: DNA photolyase family protein [Bacteroidales bacterium]|nr:DNA photolyase family protein [Bacteroidales bacterium]
MNKITIFWFRRDLRWDDNCGLYHALKENERVLPIFIFDTDILDTLDHYDGRVEFIFKRVKQLKANLEKQGASLKILHGKPFDQFRGLIRDYPIERVYFNHDYEPYAIARDLQISQLLDKNHIEVKSFKDHTIFEKDEIVKKDGKPYMVYTPYMRKWKEQLKMEPSLKYPVKDYRHRFIKIRNKNLPAMKELGFRETGMNFPPDVLNEQVISNYHLNRDYPYLNGTTRLGMHLRFGTVSIREAVNKALDMNETWLNELIWRDFYMMIMWHFPYVTDRSFKPQYDEIEWRNNEKEFVAWCEGKTGYPIVDAGMRQLNQTGYMHNRIRMIVASFLTKHLLIDWRWGESYFAEKLLDYELASNNGGWQWAAGSGCDAAPYFRIFNPDRQTERFDPEYRYIARWVPEFRDPEYEKPIISHKFARERALQVYGKALKKERI